MISESSSVCQSIPLVAFQSRAIDNKMRIVGHARFRIDFHPEVVFGVDWGNELIGVRIMLWAPKVLNLGELLRQASTLPVTAKAKVKFGQDLTKALNF